MLAFHAIGPRDEGFAPLGKAWAAYCGCGGGDPASLSASWRSPITINLFPWQRTKGSLPFERQQDPVLDRELPFQCQVALD